VNRWRERKEKKEKECLFSPLHSFSPYPHTHANTLDSKQTNKMSQTLGEDPVVGVESGTKAEQLACLGGSTSGANPESFRSTGDSTAGLDEASKHGGPGQTTHEAQAGTVTSGNAGTSDKST
jgi:hypothetical protein